LEGRYCKIAPLSCEETIRDETFDKILLYDGKNYERRKILSLKEIMKLKENSQNQEGNIDLRALLIFCAEVVSTNNKKVASELLKEIRKHLPLVMVPKGLHVSSWMYLRHAWLAHGV
jgi:F420-0:gamma-glutamyl ligase-like protein